MKKILAAALLACAGAAQAGVIVTGTVSDGGTLGQYSDGLGKYADIANQSGLSANYVSGTTDFDAFVSTTTHARSDFVSWLSALRTYSGYMVFDLGAAYDLHKFVMWNGASGIDASPRNISLSTSLTSDFSNATAVGQFASHMNNTNAIVFDIADTQARYVRLNILDTFGNFCCAAIGEVAFDVSAIQTQPEPEPVPEPGSLALLALGLASAGFSRRVGKLMGK